MRSPHETFLPDLDRAYSRMATSDAISPASLSRAAPRGHRAAVFASFLGWTLDAFDFLLVVRADFQRGVRFQLGENVIDHQANLLDGRIRSPPGGLYQSSSFGVCLRAFGDRPRVVLT